VQFPAQQFSRLPTKSVKPEEYVDFPKVGAKWGELKTGIGISDPDLTTVVQRWESLPEAVRAGIVAMVKVAVAQQ